MQYSALLCPPGPTPFRASPYADRPAHATPTEGMSLQLKYHPLRVCTKRPFTPFKTNSSSRRGGGKGRIKDPTDRASSAMLHATVGVRRPRFHYPLISPRKTRDLSSQRIFNSGVFRSYYGAVSIVHLIFRRTANRGDVAWGTGTRPLRCLSVDRDLVMAVLTKH